MGRAVLGKMGRVEGPRAGKGMSGSAPRFDAAASQESVRSRRRGQQGQEEQQGQQGQQGRAFVSPESSLPHGETTCCGGLMRVQCASITTPVPFN